MNNDKERKISFHTLITRNWRTKEEKPFILINELIPFILKLKKIDRQFDLKDSKFCFIQYAKPEEDNKNNKIITGFFKSARHKFRPNLIDKITGEERKSPKKITEGDIEKTHFSIKISDEVFLTLEINGNGISINQIVGYFTFFTKMYLTTLNKKKSYSILYTKIGRGDFLKALKELKRARVAEIYFDKSLLGNACLNYSNRTATLKRDLMITATAEKQQSINETAIDIFNTFSSGKSGISKVRIYGKDDNGANVVLDTSFIEKIDNLNVPINPETGEVTTTAMLGGLKAFLRDL